MDSWIDSYVGEWKDAAGNCLSIHKITDETARVTFLAAPGRAPIARPWCHGRPSVDMPARYYPAHGPELIVELWDEGKGFTLELGYGTPHRIKCSMRSRSTRSRTRPVPPSIGDTR